MTALTHPDDFPGAARLGLWLALIALCMAFLTLIVSYIVLRGGSAEWPPEGVRLNLPVGAANTVVIACSSAALWAALGRRRAGKIDDARLSLQLGGFLAFAFLGLQALQYYWLIRNFGQTLQSSPFGTVFYALTGLHAIHLLGGIVWLAVLWARMARREVSELAVELCSTYWHFVTLVWVVLFAALYLI